MRSVDKKIETLIESDADTFEVKGARYSLGCLTSSVGFLLRASYLQLRETLRAIDGVDIKPAMFELLKIAADNPGMLQAHAARILLIQESNMAILVRDALKFGLISRSDENAKRRQGLWLTSLGKETMMKMSVVADEVTENYLVSIDTDEQMMIKTLLAKLYIGGLERRSDTEELGNN